MPEHVYTGLSGHVYPESRDASGAWIGEVEPGDIRDLSEPLDDRWREATDEDRAAIPGLAEVRQRARDEDRFYRLLRQLGDMGLDAAILEQLVQAGAAQGLPDAEGLVSGGMVAVQQANRQAEEAADATWETQITRQTAGDLEAAGVGRASLPSKTASRKAKASSATPDSDQAGETGSKDE